jgi:hypothetical protein
VNAFNRVNKNHKPHIALLFHGLQSTCSPVHLLTCSPAHLLTMHIYVQIFQITMLTPRHTEARTDLEQIFIDKQIANPGYWDGKLLNGNGQPYNEASMGLNPLRQGYSICAPYKSE